MSLSSGFPFYFDGVYHVSLSIPSKKQSEIAKGVGVTASYPLLVPNVDYLKKFITGDIGVSDKITKSALTKSYSSPDVQKDEKVFKAFAKSTDQDIDDVKKYKKGGKYKLPKEEIKLPIPDGNGLKSFEKTLLTSIFETQKPYFEVAKLVIGNVAKIEDICARVMPLLSTNPLKAESQKPINNSGITNGRPKAIGFGGGSELKNALRELEGIKKFGGETKLDKDGKPIRTKQDLGTASISSGGNETKWKIVSTIYSTGKFDPKANYNYIYIDLPAEKDTKPEDSNLNLENDDPFEKYKPKRLIFGIFKSDGTPLDPNEKLKLIGATGEVDSQYKKADWILKSKKWYFPDGKFVWPSLGSPNYIWQRYGGTDTKTSKTKPDGDPEYSLKKYKKGDKNLISGADALEGEPVIKSFDAIDVTPHTNFINDLVKIKLNSSDLEETDKTKYFKQISSQLQIPSHVENVFKYSQAKASVYKQINNKPAFPDKMKVSFQPFQIKVKEAASDAKLKAYATKNGTDPSLVWIDPETDYELKVIRVDPTTQIDYLEAQGQPLVKTEVQSFVKSRATFKLSNGGYFDLQLRKNGGEWSYYSNLTSYDFENWNYENPGTLLDNQKPKLVDTNQYDIVISSKYPIGKYAINFTSYDFVSNSKTYRITKSSSTSVVSEGFPETPVFEFKSLSTDGSLLSVPDGSYIDDDKNTRFKVENSKIVGWYIFDNRQRTTLDGVNEAYGGNPFDKTILPVIGKEKTFLFNMSSDIEKNGNFKFTNTTKDIPISGIRVSSDSPYGKMIDPTKILNTQLQGVEAFSKGKYGHGTSDNPQEIGVIKRFMRTDLDLESYYIIEGVLTSENKTNIPAGASTSTDNYRLPHALGSTVVFASLLADIFSKLIPSIEKLLKLFKGPQAFIMEILLEKLSDGFSIFSKDSIKAFNNAKNEKIKNSNLKNSEKSERMKKIFKESPLMKHVFVDKVGNYTFLYNGIALIPFEIFGKKLDFGGELKLGEDKFLRLISSIKDAKVKNLQEELKGSLKKFKPLGSDGIASPISVSDIKNATTPDKPTDFSYDTGIKNPNDYKIIDVKYSTGVYIRGVDYNYIYITKDGEKVLKEADDLLAKRDEEISPGDIERTIEKLENAQKDDPKNLSIKDRIQKLKDKLDKLGDQSHPLIKMLLGIVTMPIKIIASIVQYIMDFFKSITNPVTLPVKIAEFLSFSWILNIVSPKGILELAGLKFKPEKLLEWKALVSIPGSVKTGSSNIPDLNPQKVPNVPKVDTPKVPTGDKLNLKSPEVPKPDLGKVSAADFKSNLIPKSKIKYKDAQPKDKFLIPDDSEVIDMSEFFSAPFLPKLPTYTARQYRQYPPNVIKIVSGILCLIEKILNSIIDFIWSTLGIEALIPAPHIKLCPESENIEDLAKIIDGNSIGSTGKPNNDGSSEDNFLYEIKLSDGRVVKGLNRQQLQEYIDKNKDVSFEYKF